MSKLNEDEFHCRQCGVVHHEDELRECRVCKLGDICIYCARLGQCLDCLGSAAPTEGDK